MKKALVTGAEGFIGSHLVEALCAKGYSVRALVLYNPLNSWGWLENVPSSVKDNVEVVLGDIRDGYSLKKAMSGCDVVFHLAALISIQFSYKCPELYVDVNTKGTLNVLQAAVELGTTKVVHTSTSEVYGSAQFVPITEEHPLRPQSPYAASKVGADQLALSFFHSFDLPVTVMRPFNTYGPRQTARAVIPTIISQLADGAKEIKLGALSPTRDFTFVEDTASAFIALAESDRSVGEVIQAGSGFEISIGDTANLIKKVMGSTSEIISDEDRMRPESSEVKRLWASNEKISKLVGWSPVYGGLDGFERGIKRTAEWFANPANLAFYKTHLYLL